MSDLEKLWNHWTNDGFVNTKFIPGICENLVGRSNINDKPKHTMSNVRQMKLHVASKIEA